MSSESKTQDWSKPAAMAIPKGGYFEDKVEQGRYVPYALLRGPFNRLARLLPAARSCRRSDQPETD